MMLTEDEAKEKWCPLTFSAPGRSEKCSTCMAWRWFGMDPVRTITSGMGAAIYEYRDNPEARTLGRCGLAGGASP